MAFCIYLGLSNPNTEAAINTGLTTFLGKITKTGRPYERTLDPYGRSLSLYGAEGNFRVEIHNAVGRELATQNAGGYQQGTCHNHSPPPNGHWLI